MVSSLTELFNWIEENSDEKYRQFSTRLTPTALDIKGVRLPLLDKKARELAKGDWQSILDMPQTNVYEAVMLQGFVLAYAPLPLDAKLKYIRAFLLKIDNWAVCDSFAMRLKVKQVEKEYLYTFLAPLAASEREFEARFALVAVLAGFVEEAYLSRVFETIDRVVCREYYVKMGQAWTIAECFGKYPQRTKEYFTDCILDDFTYNKAIQKCIESYRISSEDKTVLRAMKRKVR